MHPAHSTRAASFLRTFLTIGVLAVLLLPMARSNTQLIGFLPLWLIAMPASALWALRRVRAG
jgi:hypothetical protein